MFTSAPGALHSTAASCYQQIQSPRFADFDASRGPSHDLKCTLADGNMAIASIMNQGQKLTVDGFTMFYVLTILQSRNLDFTGKEHEVSKQITNKNIFCLSGMSSLTKYFFGNIWQYLGPFPVSDPLNNPKFSTWTSLSSSTCCTRRGEKHIVPKTGGFFRLLPVCLSLSASPSGRRNESHPRAIFPTCRQHYQIQKKTRVFYGSYWMILQRATPKQYS